jgi:hypothetical protein
MKTKTIIVTARREYIAHEMVEFEITVPDIPLKKETLERIAIDHLENDDGSLYWEHDDAKPSRQRERSLVIEIPSVT